MATPQQNGIVERKHQHILGITRALLFLAHLPPLFWAHAVSYAVHIINRLPTLFLKHKSPYQILYNILPDMTNLKVFGSLCYAATLKSNRKKLDSRSRKCINLGHKPGVKGHLLFDLHNKELFISRDVVFFESHFPYKHNLPLTSSSSHTTTHLDDLFDDVFLPNSVPNPTFNHSVDNGHTEHNSVDNGHTKNNSHSIDFNSNETNHTTHSPTNETNYLPSSNCEPIRVRRSHRQVHPPNYLKDYHCNLLHHPDSVVASSSSTCKYPISSSISYDSFSSSHKHYMLNLSANPEPTSYEHVICDENWKTAINIELQALVKTKTWDLVPLPSNKKAIGCRWVFKVKMHADGTIERYKARLVAKGFTQTEGLDYTDTLSPVVKMTTVRVCLAAAAVHNWPLFQLDVNTSFLHGDLNEEVYMKPPPGLIFSTPNLVCKLQRSLYGLKQASRQWNTKLTDTLIASGYIQSKADYSLFTKTSSQGFTMILVYVDDLVVGGTDSHEILQIKTCLDAKFSIKDLGVLKYFLGFELACSTHGISLCQRKYTLDLISDAGLLGAKPCSTPMQPHLQLHKTYDTPLSDHTPYRRLIGRLLYLTHTRPEISYAVSKLSQFLAAPTDKHMLVGLHVLKYLKNSPGQGLIFNLIPLYVSKVFQIQIRGLALIHEDPLLVFVIFLALHSLAGRARSSLSFPDLHLKLSIVLLLKLLVKGFGFSIFFMIFTSIIQYLSSFTVITNLPCI